MKKNTQNLLKDGAENSETTRPMMIGANAKKLISENLKNLESAVYGLVSALETRMYRDDRDYESMELDDEFHGTDLLRPDDKILIRILAESFANELTVFHNDLATMHEILELK